MITLHGISWDHPRGVGGLRTAAAAWNSERTDVSVEWDQRSLQEFADAPLAALAESYDLLVIDHPHVASAAADEILVDLGDHDHADRLPDLRRRGVGPSYDSYWAQGRQLAVPIDAAAHVAAWRPDLSSDLPRTWAEVLELADAGLVLWPAKPIDAYSSLLTLAAGQGHPPFAGPGVFLADDALDQALDLLRRLARRLPDEAYTMSPVDVAEALADGDRYHYAPLVFGYSNYSRAGLRRHRLTYRDLPDGGRGGALLGGAGIAVSVTSAHVTEAVDHALWLASSEPQRTSCFVGGGQPAHADAWEDVQLNRDTLDFFTGTRRSLDQAYVRPSWPGYLAFQNAVAPSITAHLRGELSESALRRTIAEEAALVGPESPCV